MLMLECYRLKGLKIKADKTLSTREKKWETLTGVEESLIGV